MHYAAAAGHVDMVMALLRLDVPLSKTKDGSALDVVNALLEGEDGTYIACPSPR